MKKTAILTAILLTGCSTVRSVHDRNLKAYGDNRAGFVTESVNLYATNSNTILEKFAEIARSNAMVDGDDWLPVIHAGFAYIDMRCSKYMGALVDFNRLKEGSSRQIQYMGAASSAALALTKASTELVGLTPLGFALVDQTINNIGKGILFELPPSTVQAIVRSKFKAYRAAMSPSYTSRAIALQVIQDYAAICLAPSIEADVTTAVANQKFEQKPAAAAAAAAAPSTNVLPNLQAVN
jgi:hypothetical protein